MTRKLYRHSASGRGITWNSGQRPGLAGFGITSGGRGETGERYDQDSRLQRYWRTHKLSLILAALVSVLFILNGDWTGLPALALCAWLAWMGTK